MRWSLIGSELEGGFMRDLWRALPCCILRQVLPVFLVGSWTVSCGKGEGIKSSNGSVGAATLDASRGAAEEAERAAFLAQFETEDFLDCRDRGLFYDRRKETCLTDLKVGKYPCTHEGVIKAFSASGGQITQILERSLGSPRVSGDKGEGYTLDQCGLGSSGRLYADLLKIDSEGKLQVREIESK